MSFEKGEDVIDQFFIQDGFAVGFPPTPLAPTKTPVRQRCGGGIPVVRIWRKRGAGRLRAFLRILRVRADGEGVWTLPDRLENACYGLRYVSLRATSKSRSVAEGVRSTLPCYSSAHRGISRRYF